MNLISKDTFTKPVVKDPKGLILDLYDTYSTVLYSFIVKIIADKVIAEEILQTVFLKALKNIETFKNKPGDAFVELLNLSRNETIETLIAINSDTRVNITRNSILPTNSTAVNSFLSSLPLCEKTVLSLVYYRHFTIVEIADLLKLPTEVIESKMRSASQKLQSIYPAPK